MEGSRLKPLLRALVRSKRPVRATPHKVQGLLCVVDVGSLEMNSAGLGLRYSFMPLNGCLAVLLGYAFTAGRTEGLEQAHRLRVLRGLPLGVPLHTQGELRCLRQVNGFDHAVFGMG